MSKEEVNFIVEEKKEIFYTCRNDRAFKEILLKESNEELLKKIIEMTLEVNIQDIAIDNIERNTGNLRVRRKNFDIFLNTDKGKIDLEMNACLKDYLHARNTAYLCDNYSHYTLVGENYTEDVQMIQINFTYEMSKKDQKILRKYYIQDEEKQKFVKNFVIYEYNMDRIMKFWYAKNEKEIENYKYLIMLDLEHEDLKKLSKKDRLVEKYKMDIEIINRNPKFRDYMTEEEDRRKCFNSEMYYARKKGLEEGRKEGRKEGHKEGFEEGIKEASIEVAKSLLKLGANTLEQIADITHLSIEEIQKLKENL